MSATNHTTTIGLSQYISTDKPTYLTDYNGDMLAIDNAIAADRDSIATAQNKADTADGKADANKTTIDTLNAQINGDPTDPSDTGMAGKLNAIDGNVNTINALLGNGSPTTSDQTVIGAINALEDTIAPSEDESTLGANYSAGNKFMRGGKLYEALVNLTSGTAFSALTLNTDYKAADRLVKQIDDVAADNQTLSGAVSGIESAINGIRYFDGATTIASVTSDGVKKWSELLADLKTAANAKLAEDTSRYYTNLHLGGAIGSLNDDNNAKVYNGTSAFNSDMRISTISNSGKLLTIKVNVSAGTYEIINDGTYTNHSDTVPASGLSIGLYAYLFKTLSLT